MLHMRRHERHQEMARAAPGIGQRLKDAVGARRAQGDLQHGVGAVVQHLVDTPQPLRTVVPHAVEIAADQVDPIVLIVSGRRKRRPGYPDGVAPQRLGRIAISDPVNLSHQELPRLAAAVTDGQATRTRRSACSQSGIRRF